MPAFRQNVASELAVDEDRLGVCAPGTSQVAFVDAGSRRERALVEYVSPLLSRQRGGGSDVAILL